MMQKLSAVRVRIETWCSPGLAVATVIVALFCMPPVAFSQEDASTDASPRILDVEPTILDVEAKVLDVEGMTLGLEGTLTDLGAKVTKTEIKITLAGDILFDFDKDTLRSEAVPTLQKIAEVLANYPDAPVLIEGYTDSKGKDSYNLKLSKRRAASVKKWLIENAGVNAGHIQTQGLGAAKPMAPNQAPDGSDDPNGRQKNRRVEITIKTG